MEKKDYQFSMLEVISMIRDKASYLKSMDASSSNFDINVYNGMAEAYYHVLDGIIIYIDTHEELTLEEFGLEDYDPKEILKYKPLKSK